jgi:hypothetical protein
MERHIRLRSLLSLSRIERSGDDSLMRPPAGAESGGASPPALLKALSVDHISSCRARQYVARSQTWPTDRDLPHAAWQLTFAVSSSCSQASCSCAPVCSPTARGHRPRLNVYLTECFALSSLRKLEQATWTCSGSVEAGSHGTAGQNVHEVDIACGAGPQEHLGRRLDVQVVRSTCDVGLVAVGGKLEGEATVLRGSVVREQHANMDCSAQCSTTGGAPQDR